MKLDKELQEFRDLMKPPSVFEDGFNWTALAGAVFLCLMMVPGTLYMHLVAGIGMEGAARWVTVILFLEIARRTHKQLKNAEIFVLFYMAGAVLASPFEGLLYRQFFVQSKAVVAQGWVDHIPGWWAPNDPEVLGTRSFFQWQWLAPIGLVILHNVITRLDQRILGFGLFKLTSDYEKLPFPLAPVGAQGILALAEEDTEGSWRWRAFSIGGAIGLIFGFVYMGIPILSTAIFGITMQPLPIPFVDWTGKTEDFLPAVATGLSFDMTHLLLGMVMPFWAVIGSALGLLATFVANPLLYEAGMLTQWREGDDTIITLFKNDVDFYLSFTIGLSLAIAVAGVWSMVSSVRRARASKEARDAYLGPPPGRGDIPNKWIIGIYLCSASIYIATSAWLLYITDGYVHKGVMAVLLFYAFFYTPIISYVTARLEGICGQAFHIPLVREAGFILSGYHGLAVWFLPIPLQNYGDNETIQYRQAELTGTKFWSLWKADLVLVPLILVSSILFMNFIWSLAPVPSEAYPYAEKIWDLNALKQTLMYSATMGEFSQFQKAFKPWVVLAGFGIGSSLFGVLSLAGAPVLLVYGAVRGLNQTLPHSMFLLLLGALLGRYYFQKRFGKMWRQYIPVVLAGFTCGMGLISMFCIGVLFLSKAVFQLSY